MNERNHKLLSQKKKKKEQIKGIQMNLKTMYTNIFGFNQNPKSLNCGNGILICSTYYNLEDNFHIFRSK